MPSLLSRARAWLPLGLCLALALGLWALFYPAFMTLDSLDQYGQARSGRYEDWHPPFMAVVLAGVLRCGGDIGLLMLAQCVGGAVGLWAFARNLLDLFDPLRTAPPPRKRWAATAIVVGLALPLTPLAFYLMTFWKDVWLAVLLLWAGAIAVRLFLAGPAGRPALGLLLPLLGGAMTLVRHNALALLPSLFLLYWLALRPRFGRLAALLLAASPAALSLGGNALLYELAPIRRTAPGNQVMALDLVGLCVLDPALADDLPYTKAHLNWDLYRQRYHFGSVLTLYWDKPTIVDSEYVALGANEALAQEYRSAWLRHPWRMLQVKVLGFAPLLKSDDPRPYIASGLYPNDLGLTQNTTFADVRARLILFARAIDERTPLAVLSGVHLPWFLINILTLGWAAVAWFRMRRPEGLFRVALLLVPLSYYLSYLIAAPGRDFRLMYPATLFMQGYALARLAAALCGARTVAIKPRPS